MVLWIKIDCTQLTIINISVVLLEAGPSLSCPLLLTCHARAAYHLDSFPPFLHLTLQRDVTKPCLLKFKGVVSDLCGLPSAPIGFHARGRVSKFLCGLTQYLVPPMSSRTLFPPRVRAVVWCQIMIIIRELRCPCLRCARYIVRFNVQHVVEY